MNRFSYSRYIAYAAIEVALVLLNFDAAACSRLSSRAAPVNASWPFQSYKTVDFYPPELKITRTGRTDNGYLFLAPALLAAEMAPLIMTDANELIWQGPTGNAYNFGAQVYQKQAVLVFWDGAAYFEPIGRGSGSVHIWSQTYEEIAVVSLGGTFLTTDGATHPSNIDLHELFITDHDTLIVLANNVTQTDLRSLGGPEDGWIVDTQVYEIDIATNEVLFEWKAVDHLSRIPLASSLYPLGSQGFDGTTRARAWGYAHCNAVSPLGDGYILSFRFLCAAIAIDSKGEVKWVLQGRNGGDFNLGTGTNFCYQHDIRASYVSATSVTLRMHDNANGPLENGTNLSSGLVLNVDLTSHNVSLNQRYVNPKDPIYSIAMGSFQSLNEDGHVFVGHGFFPKLEEFDATGDILMTVQFGAGSGTLSYRAFRQEWVGCPKTPPVVFVEAAATCGGMNVYMSWNGATEYDSWRVYGGATNDTLTLLATSPRHGFETRAIVKESAFVQVEAMVPERRHHASCGCGGPRKSAIYAVV